MRQTLAASLSVLALLAMSASCTSPPASTPARPIRPSRQPNGACRAVRWRPPPTSAPSMQPRRDEAGGSAVDAAIAAHAVLGLVEPQSSGLGGGGYMVVYDRKTNTTTVFDGRETAPATATADYFTVNGQNLGFVRGDLVRQVRRRARRRRTLQDGARQVRQAGLGRNFEAAIKLADEGFIVSPAPRQFAERTLPERAARQEPTVRRLLLPVRKSARRRRQPHQPAIRRHAARRRKGWPGRLLLGPDRAEHRRRRPLRRHPGRSLAEGSRRLQHAREAGAVRPLSGLHGSAPPRPRPPAASR